MNFTAKIDISKISGAFACKIQGKNSSKNCICIPTDATGVFVGSKGVYIDLRISELAEDKQRYEDTHIVRQSFPKDMYEQLSEDDRRSIPLLGGMRPINTTVKYINKEVRNAQQQQVEAADGLPF